ncbi:hypothetical protein QZQ69_04930 [Serratia marcescens]|uniref:hypothetical protein n=1 Tax=Serratia marcescens TaxID=615 RepID=UPI0027638057|nr:hypothetical protein [Serratia marcescens]MDP8872290.1 hypothetical protein [Serratia marcescens]
MTVQVEALTYEALKAQCDALADRVERLSGMLTESRVATKSAEERADALAEKLGLIIEHQAIPHDNDTRR